MAIKRPIIKKIKTEKIFMLFSPNSDPIYINKKITDDENSLKLKPRTEPTKAKKIINKVFPEPIPKKEPTYDI